MESKKTGESIPRFSLSRGSGLDTGEVPDSEDQEYLSSSQKKKDRRNRSLEEITWRSEEIRIKVRRRRGEMKREAKQRKE